MKKLLLSTFLLSMIVRADVPSLSRDDKAWAKVFLTELNENFTTAVKEDTNAKQIGNFCKGVEALTKNNLLPHLGSLLFELEKTEKKLAKNPETSTEVNKLKHRGEQIEEQIEFLAKNARNYFSFSWKENRKLSDVPDNATKAQNFAANLRRYGVTVSDKGVVNINDDIFAATFAGVSKGIVKMLNDESKYNGDFTKFYDDKADDMRRALHRLTNGF